MASMPLRLEVAIRLMAFLVAGILLAFNLSSLYRLEELSVCLLLFSLAFTMLAAAALACALLYYGGKGLSQRVIMALRFLSNAFVGSSKPHLGKAPSMVDRKVPGASNG